MDAQIAEPLITDAWLRQFRDRVYQVPQTQLILQLDAHRMMALAMLVTVSSHQILSDMGQSSTVRQALAELSAELSATVNASEAEPPSLSEMTVIMDMVATAFSLIEARRIATGNPDADIPTNLISGALLQLRRQACTDGGLKASGSLLPLLRPFAECSALG